MPETESSRLEPRSGAILFTFHGLLILVGLLLFSWYNRLLTMAALFAGMLLVWGGSYLWTVRSLVGVSIEETLARDRVFPGETVNVRMSIQNRKFWPLAWVQVSKPTSSHLRTDGAPFLPEAATEACRLGWLLGHQEAAYDYWLVPLRRGLYRLGPLKVQSGDPFGFFSRSRDLAGAPQLLVYPPLIEPGMAVSSWPDPLGEKQARDFLYTDPLAVAGVRDYLPGDPLRQVNWQATAKTQRLMSNILEGSVAPRVIVALGDLEPRQMPWTGRNGELAFELLLAAAATIAMDLTRQRVEVGLLHSYRAVGLHDVAAPYLEPGSGEREYRLREILTRLALLTSTPRRDLSTYLRQHPLPPRARLLVLAPVFREEAIRQWQELIPGQHLICMALDPGPQPPAGVYPLFPGWMENPDLASLALGPDTGVEGVAANDLPA